MLGTHRTNGSTNIRPNTQTTPLHPHESSLSTTTPTSGQRGIVRIDSHAEVRCGLEVHDALRIGRFYISSGPRQSMLKD